MLQRTMIFVGVLAMGLVVSTVEVGATPTNRTTISIACDRATSHASAIVTLYDGPDRTQATAPTTLECGSDVSTGKSDRIVVPTGFVAGYASIDPYEVTSGSETVTCAGDGTLSLKLACTGSAGAGATVTVR